jgi:hypothetical protein
VIVHDARSASADCAVVLTSRNALDRMMTATMTTIAAPASASACSTRTDRRGARADPALRRRISDRQLLWIDVEGPPDDEVEQAIAKRLSHPGDPALERPARPRT